MLRISDLTLRHYGLFGVMAVALLVLQPHRAAQAQGQAQGESQGEGQGQAKEEATVSRGENFSAKPAPALFASDCTGGGCHKAPQGLVKGQSQTSLAGFLREHYTNSRESAAALAAYLVKLPNEPARSEARQSRPRPPRASARSDETESAKPPARAQTGSRGQRAQRSAAPPIPPEPPAPAAAPAPPPPKKFDIFD